MKKLFKFGCLGFIALVALGIIVGMLSGGGDETTTADQTKQTEPAKKSEEPKPIHGDQITKPNFESIQQGDTLTGEGGMTIDEVTAILGKPDSKTESQTGDMKMEDLIWHKGITGPTVSVSFINGKVSSKLWME